MGNSPWDTRPGLGSLFSLYRVFSNSPHDTHRLALEAPLAIKQTDFCLPIISPHPLTRVRIH